eukprot:jgi/Picsp_1/2434/NSC_05895-R1_protein
MSSKEVGEGSGRQIEGELGANGSRKGKKNGSSSGNQNVDEKDGVGGMTGETMSFDTGQRRAEGDPRTRGKSVGLGGAGDDVKPKTNDEKSIHPVKTTPVMGVAVKRRQRSEVNDDEDDDTAVQDQLIGKKREPCDGGDGGAEDDEDDENEGDKKMRLVWTQELHNRFINALSHLGLKQAVPKNILGLMNVEGMTRENVASHLQKYRLYLKKIGGYTEKDKVDHDELQKLHETNVEQMASHQAMQQSMALLPVGFENSSMPGGFGNFPPHFQTEMPAGPSGGYETPHVVDGIPVEEAAHAFMPRRLPAPGQQEPLSPTVTAAIEAGGQFDPQLWQYPDLPGESDDQGASNALQFGPGPSGHTHHRIPTSVAPDSGIHYHDNYGNEQEHSWGMGLHHDNPDKLFDDHHTEKHEAPSHQDTNADEKDDDGDLLVESNQQQQMIS